MNDTRLTHIFVGSKSNHVSGKGKFASTNGRFGVNSVQHDTIFDIPKANGVVGGSGQKVFGLPVNVKTPNCSTMTIISSQTFTID
jgi:hypothetical protein